ncbi:MAG: hypothetical protein KGL39_12545 [Patescibacteria group bacterium]|nr:hypothetical protein [Patescibacteria group bacterium]
MNQEICCPQCKKVLAHVSAEQKLIPMTWEEDYWQYDIPKGVRLEKDVKKYELSWLLERGVRLACSDCQRGVFWQPFKTKGDMTYLEPNSTYWMGSNSSFPELYQSSLIDQCESELVNRILDLTEVNWNFYREKILAQMDKATIQARWEHRPLTYYYGTTNADPRKLLDKILTAFPGMTLEDLQRMNKKRSPYDIYTERVLPLVQKVFNISTVMTEKEIGDLFGHFLNYCTQVLDGTLNN